MVQVAVKFTINIELSTFECAEVTKLNVQNKQESYIGTQEINREKY